MMSKVVISMIITIRSDNDKIVITITIAVMYVYVYVYIYTYDESTVIQQISMF